MTSQTDVAAYRTALNDLTTLAVNELASALVALKDAKPAVVRDTLIAAFPELIGPYITASGELAATWYEDLRRAAVGGTFYATASGTVNQAQVDALVRWGVRPLYGQSTATVLSLVGGGVQRMIAGAGRDTVIGNIGRERVKVGYARIPKAGCCAFCAMLASRGAVYHSQESAGGVVGAGSTRTGFDESGKRLSGGIGGGIKARGAQHLGDRYHDWCRCVAAPVFVGDTFDQEIAKKYMAMYPGVGSGGVKGALADMREQFGIK